MKTNLFKLLIVAALLNLGGHLLMNALAHVEIIKDKNAPVMMALE